MLHGWWKMAASPVTAPPATMYRVLEPGDVYCSFTFDNPSDYPMSLALGSWNNGMTWRTQTPVLILARTSKKVYADRTMWAIAPGKATIAWVCGGESGTTEAQAPEL